MRRILALAAAAFVALSSGAFAGDKPVVVELFTSQGCSSCPPADQLLGKLAQDDDLIAMSLHVDYWDYIGWKDKFAAPIYTKRQKSYARTGGRRMVYTPQMIVQGQDHVVGNRPKDVGELIRVHERQAQASAVDVTASASGGKVSIKVTTSRPVGKSVVQLVRLSPRETVAIKRGENAGRSITYHNVVRDWKQVSNWNGKVDRTFSAKANGSGRWVVIVQGEDFGPILAANWVR